MLDIKFIRNNPDIVKLAAKNKNVAVDVDKLLALDERRRHLQGELDQVNSFRNALARASESGKPSPDQIAEGKKYKEQAAELEKELQALSSELQNLLYKVPNIPTDDTPIGTSEAGNQIIKTWGEKPVFDFTPKPHWELGETLDIIDNERAGNVSGARFTYLKREAALMEYALVQFAMSVIIKKGFVPVVPPIFIKPDVFQKMARLEPKEERYHIPSDDLYLIGSAEHTMGPMHMDEIIPEKSLPLRYVAFSPALRREAGAAGKDTRGIIRLHEFHKVEMEVFSTPEQAIDEHMNLIAIQKELLQGLGLPYQVILKCTADIGDPNARGVDINTWMPGQDRFCETHTADYMADYQARRLNTKYRKTDGDTAFVHMSDATAIAIGRTIAAILENYQTKEGTINIPKALEPWMMGITEIKRSS
ncbi:MAG: serine--tRNA ligase [Candidatus Yanofskybacteria bacterium RIFCSPLOWO2_01_FULL_49_25]|uniref:Serine--tRNA ligase n=1 Tax=Candidatus Yanofskybacteria bacterium RIFCSPLOWO2_01_FULL_49_25 TaxID=1802701 RepID=A0A1F8GWE6_9BACT|nr:MAG: serine--tRNA ligase [Candidatus Yanofskybacteria bacterium RIFCSPLOWO2_01_FULL_49_25]